MFFGEITSDKGKGCDVCVFVWSTKSIDIKNEGEINVWCVFASIKKIKNQAINKRVKSKQMACILATPMCCCLNLNFNFPALHFARGYLNLRGSNPSFMRIGSHL
jgi:hypothetical protein